MPMVPASNMIVMTAVLEICTAALICPPPEPPPTALSVSPAEPPPTALADASVVPVAVTLVAEVSAGGRRSLEVDAVLESSSELVVAIAVGVVIVVVSSSSSEKVEVAVLAEVVLEVVERIEVVTLLSSSSLSGSGQP